MITFTRNKREGDFWEFDIHVGRLRRGYCRYKAYRGNVFIDMISITDFDYRGKGYGMKLLLELFRRTKAKIVTHTGDGFKPDGRQLFERYVKKYGGTFDEFNDLRLKQKRTV